METAKPKKEDRRVRYTKQAIRDGFLRLLAEKPIEKISVTEICREADINRGTFYAHYSDPYELKRSLEDQLSDALAHRLQESGLKRLTSLQTLRLLSENRELCRVFAGPYGDHDAMRELQYCRSASITSAHVSQLPHTAWQLPRSASFIIKRSVSRLFSPFSRKSPSMMSSSASEKLIFSRSPLK